MDNDKLITSLQILSQLFQKRNDANANTVGTHLVYGILILAFMTLSWVIMVHLIYQTNQLMYNSTAQSGSNNSYESLNQSQTNQLMYRTNNSHQIPYQKQLMIMPNY
jgi:predicted PurR-regulated permease PerM